MIHKNNFVSDNFGYTEHNPCEIGTIGKTIKSYIVHQIMNEAVQSSEEISQEEGDSDDIEDRSNRSSKASYDNEDGENNSDSPSSASEKDKNSQEYE